MDGYMNTLNGTTRPQTTGNNRTVNMPHKTPGSSPEQDMQRHADEFNRSVTIIFWYKTNVEPIRLHHSIPTFPYFQLSRFTSLISDLGLTSNSYLDTYDPTSTHWEQHTISTVRLVGTQQRLLYRVRKNLLEGLNEDECIGLRGEVQLQHKPIPASNSGLNGSSNTDSALTLSNSSPLPTNSPGQISDTQLSSSLKRNAPENEDSEQANKVHIPNGYYGPSLEHANSSQSPVAGPSKSPPTSSNMLDRPSGSGNHDEGSPSNDSSYMHPQLTTFFGVSPMMPTNISAYPANPPTDISGTSIPYHPHPPLKRWPNDYTVLELTTGFNAIDTLVAQSPASANMTKRNAFERVFGSRYVKSTVCRHRAIWRKANRALREQYEAMGTDDRACWGEFVRRIEGRPSGKPISAALSPVQNALAFHSQPQPSLGSSVDGVGVGDERRDDPLMDSLQIPTNASGSSVSVNPPLHNKGHSQSQNVYDPALAQHLPNSSRT